jgi:hypothetical protein
MQMTTQSVAYLSVIAVLVIGLVGAGIYLVWREFRYKRPEDLDVEDGSKNEVTALGVPYREPEPRQDRPKVAS